MKHSRKVMRPTIISLVVGGLASLIVVFAGQDAAAHTVAGGPADAAGIVSVAPSLVKHDLRWSSPCEVLGMERIFRLPQHFVVCCKITATGGEDEGETGTTRRHCVLLFDRGGELIMSKRLEGSTVAAAYSSTAGDLISLVMQMDDDIWTEVYDLSRSDRFEARCSSQSALKPLSDGSGLVFLSLPVAESWRCQVTKPDGRDLKVSAPVVVRDTWLEADLATLRNQIGPDAVIVEVVESDLLLLSAADGAGFELARWSVAGQKVWGQTFPVRPSIVAIDSYNYLTYLPHADVRGPSWRILTASGDTRGVLQREVFFPVVAETGVLYGVTASGDERRKDGRRIYCVHGFDMSGNTAAAAPLPDGRAPFDFGEHSGFLWAVFEDGAPAHGIPAYSTVLYDIRPIAEGGGQAGRLPAYRLFGYWIVVGSTDTGISLLGWSGHFDDGLGISTVDLTAVKLEAGR